MKITRCLSLIQPWATLIAIGAKKVETRSWSTPYRGWLAIHASKGFPADCRALCNQEPFATALFKADFRYVSDLPLGRVIAVARLTDCVSTNVWTPDPGSTEYYFGGYGPDRFGWKLEDIRSLHEPFEAKGSLGIWTLPRAIEWPEPIPHDMDYRSAAHKLACEGPVGG